MGRGSLGDLWSSRSPFFPTPSANEPGWVVGGSVEVVDRNGRQPSHPNQRFYDKNTGRVVQKGLSQVVTMFPTPTAGKNTPNTTDPADLVNADGTPWEPGNKPHDRRTGKPVTTTLADRVRYPTPNTMDALPPKSPEALLREATVARPGRKQPANLRDVVANGHNWPTPTVNGKHNKKGTSEKSGDGLSTAVKQSLWPTPRASEREQANSSDNGAALSKAVKQPWPTPSARDYKGASKTGAARDSLDNAVERGETKNKIYPTPTAGDHTGATRATNKQGGNSLREEIAQQTKYATPTASEYRIGAANRYGNPKKSNDLKGQIFEQEGRGVALNPNWEEWLMGWPIGWTSLDPLPPERFYEWLNGTLGGTWWLRDPHPNPPRATAEKIENRTNRVKAIGNGQVSLQAYGALLMLSGQPLPFVPMEFPDHPKEEPLDFGLFAQEDA